MMELYFAIRVSFYVLVYLMLELHLVIRVQLFIL